MDEPRLQIQSPHPAVEGSAVLDLYVALKAKPIAILRGRCGAGKLEACRSLARRLAGPDRLAFQEMIGHAWWASGSPGVATFTEAQSRFNMDKLGALIDEASRPEKSDILHGALLGRISLAELDSLSDLADGIRHERNLWSEGLPPSKSSHFPPNVVLMATIDSTDSLRWGANLMASASILSVPSWGGHGSAIPAEGGSAYLASAVRHPAEALQRLRQLPGWRDVALRPLFAAVRALEDHAVPGARRAAAEALVYLANAWTSRGTGVFDRSFLGNLHRALDFALAVALIPRLEAWDEPLSGVAARLTPMLEHGFPRTSNALAWLSQRTASAYTSPAQPQGKEVNRHGQGSGMRHGGGPPERRGKDRVPG